MSKLIDAIFFYVRLYPYKSLLVLISLALIFITLAIIWLRKGKKKQLKHKSKKVKTSLKVFYSFAFLAAFFTILSAYHVFKIQKRAKDRKMVVENLAIHFSKNYLFGIDVSHYNGYIDWDLIKKSEHQVQFVYVRATMGKNGNDLRYHQNIQGARSVGLLTGVYHYYRPNENSNEQFEHFKTTVKLKSGDLIPVVDVEEMSIYGKENLIRGVKNFIRRFEEEFNIKPIIYSGNNFYHDYLSKDFKDYHLWIAAYSKKDLPTTPWLIHQFTDKIKILGVNYDVDGNYFKGTMNDLQLLTIP